MSKTDAKSVITTYVYDALNRLTELRTPNSELTTYDRGGRVCLDRLNRFISDKLPVHTATCF
ncbi:MAG TPA: hypothetical protein ENH45_03235 [Nitrospirae bacterium]|nr:hypothetical protein [Nitrospirota bacterium]